MIIRIVRMHFRADGVENFMKVFGDSQEAIRRFPGCQYMELMKDVRNLNTFVTISHWDDVSSLEQYRQSALFQSVWVRVKPLFAARAEAFTVERVEQ